MQIRAQAHLTSGCTDAPISVVVLFWRFGGAPLNRGVGLRAAPTWIECNEHDFGNRQRCANDVHGKRRSLARNPTGRS